MVLISILSLIPTLQVDYHDWSMLETGDEQANFIYSLIFPESVVRM